MRLEDLSLGYETPQLYDEGEEDWELKLHVGCADVYLEGYINIDVEGFHPYERPDLVEANSTSIKSYYGRKEQRAKDDCGVPLAQEIAVDSLADMRQLPYSPTDKIVCIQAFEHLTRSDANSTLLHWWNALKVGGIVIISVPDPVAIAELFVSNQPGVRDFAIRHIIGSDRNVYALDHWAYTEENLRQMLTGYGFVDIERLENIHFYPAVILKARKSDPRCRGREYQRLPELHEGEKILDVGPGHFPLAAATHFLDLERYDECPGDIPLTIFDLNDNPRMPFHDDEFDFVYCSHVLEHLEHPKTVLDELQRVGRRGYVEVPSLLLDFMMKFGKNHSRWACWGQKEGEIVFIEKTEAQNRLFVDFERAWASFFHGAVHGTRVSAPQRGIRFFFWENQDLLNISAHWDKGTKRKVTAKVWGLK